MNYSELVKKVAQNAKLPKAAIDRILKAFADVTIEELRKKDRLRIKGFGIFSVSLRRSRKVRNPRTGDILITPPRNVVKFKAAASIIRLLSER